MRHQAMTARWLSEHNHRSLLMHPRGSSPRDENNLVTNRTMTTLGGAFGLYDAMQLTIALPIALYQDGDDLEVVGFPGQSISGPGNGLSWKADDLKVISVLIQSDRQSDRKLHGIIQPESPAQCGHGPVRD